MGRVSNFISCVLVLIVLSSSPLIISVNANDSQMTTSKVDYAPTKIYEICGNSKFHNDWTKEIRGIYTPFSHMQTLGFSALQALAAEHYTSIRTVQDKKADKEFHGTYQCQAGIPLPTCAQCVASAFQSLLNDCPRREQAWIQLDKCFAMYSFKTNFEEKLNVDFRAQVCDASNDSTLVGDINNAIDNVIHQALLTPPVATSVNSTISNSNTTIYALAQCHSYQTEDQCRACLFEATKYRCNGGSLRGQVYLGNCFYRYDVTPFFDVDYHFDPNVFYSNH